MHDEVTGLTYTLVNTSDGHYNVIVTKPDGTKVPAGSLWKKVERFNLRRVVTTTQWIAYSSGGIRLDTVMSNRLRRDAVGYVLREYVRQQKRLAEDGWAAGFRSDK